jgi:hypothetical protein
MSTQATWAIQMPAVNHNAISANAEFDNNGLHVSGIIGSSAALRRVLAMVTGTASFTVQLLNFLKNTATAGGLLFIGAAECDDAPVPQSFIAEQCGADTLVCRAETRLGAALPRPI